MGQDKHTEAHGKENHEGSESGEGKIKKRMGGGKSRSLNHTNGVSWAGAQHKI